MNRYAAMKTSQLNVAAESNLNLIRVSYPTSKFVILHSSAKGASSITRYHFLGQEFQGCSFGWWRLTPNQCAHRRLLELSHFGRSNGSCSQPCRKAHPQSTPHSKAHPQTRPSPKPTPSRDPPKHTPTPEPQKVDFYEELQYSNRSVF